MANLVVSPASTAPTGVKARLLDAPRGGLPQLSTADFAVRPSMQVTGLRINPGNSASGGTVSNSVQGACSQSRLSVAPRRSARGRVASAVLSREHQDEDVSVSSRIRASAAGADGSATETSSSGTSTSSTTVTPVQPSKEPLSASSVNSSLAIAESEKELLLDSRAGNGAKVIGSSKTESGSVAPSSASVVDSNLETTLKLSQKGPSASNARATIVRRGSAFVDVKGGAAPALEQEESVRTAWEALLRWSHSLQDKDSKDNALAVTNKVVVFGGGSFGTAMAALLARNKEAMDVVILLRDEDLARSINNQHRNVRYLDAYSLPSNVRATTDASEAIEGAQYALHAVPVQATRKFLSSIRDVVPPTLPILSVSKGLEASTGLMMSQIIPLALKNPRQPLAVLSGPTFSSEMMDKLPTAIVAASTDQKLSRKVQQLFASQSLRVNVSSDVIGVEMAGALKNVLAIAAGIVAGMNLGNNAQAAIVAQGCSEIRWLAEKMGAKPATLAGVSGVGDIMLTCFVDKSRNRSVGKRLGAGETLEDILASNKQVAEGVATAGAVIALARKYRVSLPVLTAVARIVDGQLTPRQAMVELMNLPQVEER